MTEDGMKQIDGAFPAPFERMSDTEIIAYFKRYGFKDELGHTLEMCGDFLDLVRFAKRED
nr:MAG TPA: hypothetical protein [Caudoviricetes sp.]